MMTWQFLATASKKNVSHVSSASKASTPVPVIPAESDWITRSIHAGASGSVQSGTWVSLAVPVKLIPLVVNPHGMANTSVGVAPLPTHTVSFAALAVVGLAMAFSFQQKAARSGGVAVAGVGVSAIRAAHHVGPGVFTFASHFGFQPSRGGVEKRLGRRVFGAEFHRARVIEHDAGLRTAFNVRRVARTDHDFALVTRRPLIFFRSQRAAGGHHERELSPGATHHDAIVQRAGFAVWHILPDRVGQLVGGGFHFRGQFTLARHIGLAKPRLQILRHYTGSVSARTVMAACAVKPSGSRRYWVSSTCNDTKCKPSTGNAASSSAAAIAAPSCLH